MVDNRVVVGYEIESEQKEKNDGLELLSHNL